MIANFRFQIEVHRALAMGRWIWFSEMRMGSVAGCCHSSGSSSFIWMAISPAFNFGECVFWFGVICGYHCRSVCSGR
jgi:hypothetical protein